MTRQETMFRRVVQSYRVGEAYAGVNSITGWRLAFAEMRQRLEGDGAKEQERAVLHDALAAAMDAATDRELTDDERAALHAVLDTAFDKMPRDYKTTLAPKADFLRHVRFPAEH